MSAFMVGETHVTIRDLERLGQAGGKIILTPDARARIARSREIVAAYAAGDEPIYGLNTGLGGNLGHRIDKADIEAFQTQIVLGRNIGVGDPLPRAACRAAVAARIITAARGTTGLSQSTVDALVTMFNAGVTPVIPARGSLGATDLGLNAHIGAVLIGRGRAWFGDEQLPGAEALAKAGLAPIRLEPKDGLGVANQASANSGLIAVTLSALADTLLAAAAAASLAFEGYAANPRIFDPRLSAAYPSGEQVTAAALFRALLTGSSIHDDPRKIQDAVSFRTLSPQFGMALAAFAQARRETEVQLNHVQDTPLVLLDEGLMLSSPNFHSASLALALDAMAIAVAQLATATVHRLIKLMAPQLSGLPKYLSPVGGASAGYVSTQKLAGSLHQEIKLYATPASLDAVPVSDAVEDVAPHTMLAARKLADQLVPYRLLVAQEAVVAAQACDLREGLRLGAAGQGLHAVLRARVPMLREDREPGLDIMAAHDVLFADETLAMLASFATGLDLPLA
jgi:histidine ammonia-lyase